jgi:hypothetical protein
VNYRFPLCAAVLAVATTAAMAAKADGIDSGLWKVITRTETGGVIGPPHESAGADHGEFGLHAGRTQSRR